jgi:hypothetical protein
MAIETMWELFVMLFLSCAYIIAAIYLIWVVLPVWFRGPGRSR